MYESEKDKQNYWFVAAIAATISGKLWKDAAEIADGVLEEMGKRFQVKP